MDRKVPRNPKYEHIGPSVQTGKTIRKVEILSNQSVARRKGEIFKRIKPTTLAKLLEQTTHMESIYRLGREDDEEMKAPMEDNASVYSAAQSTTSAVTLATEQLGLTVKTRQAETEFILLDLREPDEYEKYHIKDALSFPAPNITRDRILPEIFRFVPFT
jgi:centrosomal protein CEP41